MITQKNNFLACTCRVNVNRNMQGKCSEYYTVKGAMSRYFKSFLRSAKSPSN